MTGKLHTKWGTAKIIGDYYRITSRIEGNNNKKLHRLIYEDFWGVKLPKQVIIYHKDGNKLNNCILNLEAMLQKDHSKHHNMGRNHNLSSKLNMSKSQNTTGYFRVRKQYRDTYVQGFTYIYQYYDENSKRKHIYGVDIDELKRKVLDKGLEWRELT